jgi:membrane-associated protease RseP (regulator of RpoE activity)
VPTQPVAGTTPPGPPPWGQPPSGSDTPGARRSNTVAVPKWVLGVVGALVVALIGFGVGYAVAPGGGNDSTATRVVPGPFGGNGSLNPNLNPNGNGGNGNGNGNGGQLPTIPGRGNLSGGFLGVVSTTSTDPGGARVTQVVSDSPAGDAGLKADDVITKVDGDAVTSPAELARRIQAKDAGDTVKITYVRDGDTKTADVKLISRRDGLQQSTPSTTTPGQ